MDVSSNRRFGALKAALLTAPGFLAVEEVEDPSCPPGGLLIEVEACSICASDVKMVRSGHRALNYPRILGHEVVGWVAETDAENRALTLGKLVQIWPGVPCGRCSKCLNGADNMCSSMQIMGFSHDGGFAQLMAVSQEAVRAGAINFVPESVSPEEASLTEPLACCLQGLERSGLVAGEHVLIFGGGPMGLMSALAAKSEGMEATVIETDEVRRRLGRALELKVIGPDDINEMHQLDQSMDGILLCTPEVPISSDLIPFLAPRGSICVFSGLPPQESRATFDWNALHYRELSICGSYGCSSENNRKALELIISGKVRVSDLITCHFPLSEINRGLEYSARREGLKCVINDFR